MTTTARLEPGTHFRPQPPGERRAPQRTQLQRQGSRTLNRHLLRAVLRVVVLSGADLGTFVLMRTGVYALRDQALFGSAVAEFLGEVVPRGMWAGWQFGAGLLVGLVVSGAYGHGDKRRDVRRLFLASALAVGLAMWSNVWGADGLLALPKAAFLLAMVWATVSIERTVLDYFLYRMGWRPHRMRTVMIGSPGECEATVAGPAFVNGSQYRVVGHLDPTSGDRQNAAAAVRRAIVENRADVLVICGYLNEGMFGQVVEAGREAGCQLLAVPRRFRQTGFKPVLVWERDQPLMALASPELKAQHLFVKRVVDVVGAAIGILVLAPVFGIIAFAIRLDSRGRVMFAQERVGLGGRVFRMLKFRTMKHGADGEKGLVAHLNHTGDPRLFKIPNDPRVTRVGRFLRRWSLDELPQLWNVLRGDMSLVGPRPFFEIDLAGYADHHFTRLGAKPGITGLWQVKGRSSVVDFEEVVRLDREYIDRWSMWLDLKILLLTVPAVFARTGAY